MNNNFIVFIERNGIQRHVQIVTLQMKGHYKNVLKLLWRSLTYIQIKGAGKIVSDFTRKTKQKIDILMNNNTALD